MSNHDQKKASETLTRTNIKLKKSDHARINLLFVKWRNWLYHLSFVYFLIYLVWQTINRKLSDLCFSLDAYSDASDEWDGSRNRVVSWKTFPVLVVLSVVRGLVFCADGIVSSWLKSPFGQITYSVNKSGIESSKSDEIIAILTEVNEHFKETFKKFGIYAISADLISIIVRTAAGSSGDSKETKNDREKIKEEIKSSKDSSMVDRPSERILKKEKISNWGGLRVDPENIGLISLVVPVLYGCWRIKSVEKMIKNLESEND